MTTHQEIESWRAELDGLHARIARRFRRSEARDRAKRYLAGLLDQVERKNGWQLAEHLGEAGPHGMQRLLNAADWDADAVRDDLRAYVVEHLGEPDGVLIVDETGFLKKGTKSVGVQRQYSGTAGQIENCQIGVFLGYASSCGVAFLDRALYLPAAWADDPNRRAEAGVPTAASFATKPQLAQHMLERAFAAAVPAAWVTGDKIYGDDPDLRHWLEAADHPYVLAVSRTHAVWNGGTQEAVQEVVNALPDDAWSSLSAGAGSQGERLYEWVCLQLPYAATAGMAQWLLARRRLDAPTEIAYFRAFGLADSAVEKLVQVAGMRWAIEEGFAEAKSVVGLDQYEVRKWVPWYRHVTLALLAHAYLAVLRLNANSTETKRGAIATSSR